MILHFAFECIPSANLLPFQVLQKSRRKIDIIIYLKQFNFEEKTQNVLDKIILLNYRRCLNYDEFVDTMV